MEKKFIIGDVVVLKSGGPVMTITSDIRGMDIRLGWTFNGIYLCAWFEGVKKYEDDFPQDSLKLAT